MFSNIDLEIAYMDFHLKIFSFKKSKDENKKSKNHTPRP